MKKQNKKLNLAALKNKIKKDLILIGASAINELIPLYSKSFDFIVFPENYKSSKIIELERTAQNYNIPIQKDNRVFELVERREVDNVRVIAFLKQRIGTYYALNEILELAPRLEKCTVVAFPDIDYEQNLGAMFRTCVGMGVDFIIVPHGQQKVFSSTVTKVAMGYNYLIPVVQENFLLALDRLKDSGFDILALDMEGENIQNMRYNSEVCFVVGNEGKGLSDTVVRKCTKTISIPLSQNVESFNVSVSLGIALYDRNKKLNEIKR